MELNGHFSSWYRLSAWPELETGDGSPGPTTEEERGRKGGGGKEEEEQEEEEDSEGRHGGKEQEEEVSRHRPKASNGHGDSDFGDGQEDPQDYCPGGYHPVRKGDLFNSRYHVVRKLGWGHFSTVWLCWDTWAKRFVALKVVKSALHYARAARDEVSILQRIREADSEDPYRERVVALLDNFRVSGPNGIRMCMVFEALGQQLLLWIVRANYRGIPIACVKTIIRQVLQALEYLHGRCGVIHTDIKPENVLLCVGDDYLRRLAAHATDRRRTGVPAQGPPRRWREQSYGRREEEEEEEKRRAAMAATSEGAPRPQRRLRPARSDEEEEEEGGAMSSGDDGEGWGATGGGAVGSEDGVDGGVVGSEDGEEGVSENGVDGESADGVEGEAAGSEDLVDGGAGGREERGAVTMEELSSPATPLHVVPSAADLLPDVLDPASAEHLLVKVVDLGNACWVDKHFSDDIQTRQYRALEVLLGAEYGTPADIWSTACMAFELATGGYLFEPHSGEGYSRDEDHIAHIIELLGNLPRSFAMSGRYSREIFNSKGEMRHIDELTPWPLPDVLLEKYGWSADEASAFASFLLPMLAPRPWRRATAAQSLDHEWLQQQQQQA
uniref:non-specific serine/threonine protein kinase n=1 Tax=Petromyzon marinus TaxID=7757 RepID=A0AAJ7U403_PETMA|nr:SRSF protein kinase 3-like [Petromyzon marinus]